MSENKTVLKNKKDFNTTRETNLILDVLENTIKSLDSQKLISESIKLNNESLEIHKKSIDLENKNIFVVGAGKSVKGMAIALEKILGNKIKNGWINGLDYQKLEKLEKINFTKATYPYTSKTNINATTKMINNLKKEISEKDIILFLLSDGASSMLSLPVDEIPTEDFIEINESLDKSNIEDSEMDKLRKHISQIKGGKFSQMFENNMYTLIFSDVISGDATVIGSTPTDYDKSTFQDASNIIKELKSKKLTVPKSVEKYINEGLKGKHSETLKTMPENSKLFVLGDQGSALGKIEKYIRTKKLRYNIINLNKEYTDSNNTINEISELISSNMTNAEKKPIIFLSVGEPTISLNEKSGKGGRNQHLVLLIAKKLCGLKTPWSVLSFNTEGNDSIDNVGGAIVDNKIVEEYMKNKEINSEEFIKIIDSSLEKQDSYTLLSEMKSIIESEHTGINFGDIFIGFLGADKVIKKKHGKYNKKNFKKRKK